MFSAGGKSRLYKLKILTRQLHPLLTRFIVRRWAKVVEVLMVCTVTVSIGFIMIFFVNDCKPLGSKDNVEFPIQVNLFINIQFDVFTYDYSFRCFVLKVNSMLLQLCGSRLPRQVYEHCFMTNQVDWLFCTKFKYLAG